MPASDWEGLSPPYATIVVDPPWSYPEGFVNGSGGIDGGRLDVTLPYSSMSIEQIADLPVRDLASPAGAFLWLWTTNKFLPDAFDVIGAWGFRYRQCLVWHKGDSHPFVRAVAPNTGEFLLFARRGGARRIGTAPSSIVHAVKGAHSTKPGTFFDLIESISPAPRCELFARAPRLGWDHWGYGHEQGSSNETRDSNARRLVRGVEGCVEGAQPTDGGPNTRSHPNVAGETQLDVLPLVESLVRGCGDDDAS